jgi:hypothetical protein
MATKAAASKPLWQTLPLEEQVRQRASELYIQCGGESDSERDDCLQAEQEILMATEQTAGFVVMAESLLETVGGRFGSDVEHCSTCDSSK